MEKYVYLTTPDYMMAFIEESKLYSFYVKAYPNSKSGYKNLVQTNLSSILGFVFFYEELPEDLTYLIKFINFLNLIGDKSTLVLLAVNNPSGVKDFLFPRIRTDKITFKYITDFETVTDSFIRRSLLGTVVVHNFEPYIESVKSIQELTSYNTNDALNPILPGDILSILSPTSKLNNSDNTIKHDEVMNNAKGNGLVMYMRINYIKASFGDEIDIDGMKKRIDSIEGLNKIVYYSIINIIKTLRDKVLKESDNAIEDREDLRDVIENKEIEGLTTLVGEEKEEILVGEEKEELLVEEDLTEDFDYESLFNYQEGEYDELEDEDDLSDLF